MMRKQETGRPPRVWVHVAAGSRAGWYARCWAGFALAVMAVVLVFAR
jgi:hypothetical protein